jgi:hypothetical protein
MRVFPRVKPRTRVKPLLVATLAFSLSLLPARSLAAGSSLEYQVKAGFLFNFAKFVDWPDSTRATHKTLRLGIVAPDDIYDLMASALSGKVANNRPIQIEKVTAAELEKGTSLPDIIFVQQDASRTRQDGGFTQQQIFAAAANQPVLLVGESAGFATSGGMIGFVQRGENLRFQVNLANAQRAGLKLSARLSGLAEIVTTAP